jgi:nucleoside-diphosphate-sugar epimerase
MKVFLTGATGFVGRAVGRELIAGGHTVLGVARTDEAARTLSSAGIEPHLGDLTEPGTFVAGALVCDAVIQCAFIHDFSRYAENIEVEGQAVSAMLDALAGSGKVFIATSGIGMLAPGRAAVETDTPARQGRGATEALVREAATRGLRTAVVRLPPITHDEGDGGFLPALVQIARDKGMAAYIGDGAYRWPAGHRLDAARLYRLVLEKGEPGAAYHAVADEGVPMRQIAEAIAERLGLETASIDADQAANHYGWLGFLAGVDMPASSALTQERLGWRPTHPGLIEDIKTAAAIGAARAP